MNLLKAAASVSAMTLLSRITGFVRDTLLAIAFGAGLTMDAFVVAFRLPNLLRRLFAEGAFSQAFVPILGEYKARRGEEATRLLAARVLGSLMAALLAVTAVGVVAAPLLVYGTAWGFAKDADKFSLTVTMLRICFPYIFFISLTSFAAGILNTWGQFKVPAFTPVLLNLSFIGFALLAAPHFERPVVALAWAVFVGGVLQLAFQLPFLLRIRMLPAPKWDPRDEGVVRILKLMAPAALGVSVAQVSLVINTQIASWLGDGPVSWLYYADRLMEFPAGLLGAALGTILLPSLARAHANAQGDEFSALLDWGLRLTLLLTLPAALALAMLAVPLLATLFQHGAFTADDVLQTRSALVAYSIGLAGLILVKVLAPGFYARQDIRTPVKIALITLAATQAMNLAFIGWIRHAGLALSIGLASCLNAALLYRGLRRRGVFVPAAGWMGFSTRIAIALAALGTTLWFAMGSESAWLAMPFGERILRLSLIVAAGMASYFVTLFLLGFRIGDFRRRT